MNLFKKILYKIMGRKVPEKRKEIPVTVINSYKNIAVQGRRRRRYSSENSNYVSIDDTPFIPSHRSDDISYSNDSSSIHDSPSFGGGSFGGGGSSSSWNDSSSSSSDSSSSDSGSSNGGGDGGGGGD